MHAELPDDPRCERSGSVSASSVIRVARSRSTSGYGRGAHVALVIPSRVLVHRAGGGHGTSWRRSSRAHDRVWRIRLAGAGPPRPSAGSRDPIPTAPCEHPRGGWLRTAPRSRRSLPCSGALTKPRRSRRSARRVNPCRLPGYAIGRDRAPEFPGTFQTCPLSVATLRVVVSPRRDRSDRVVDDEVELRAAPVSTGRSLWNGQQPRRRPLVGASLWRPAAVVRETS